MIRAAMKLAPRKVSLVDAYKYDIDANRHWLIRFLFKWVWCTFVEIGLEWFKFPLWDTKEVSGNRVRYSYREFQGVFSEPWLAAQEAAKHDHPSIMEWEVNEAAPVNSVLATTTHPNATTKAYDRINDRSVSVPKETYDRLAQKIKDTDAVVAAHKSLLA